MASLFRRYFFWYLSAYIWVKPSARLGLIAILYIYLQCCDNTKLDRRTFYRVIPLDFLLLLLQYIYIYSTEIIFLFCLRNWWVRDFNNKIEYSILTITKPRRLFFVFVGLYIVYEYFDLYLIISITVNFFSVGFHSIFRSHRFVYDIKHIPLYQSKIYTNAFE